MDAFDEARATVQQTGSRLAGAKAIMTALAEHPAETARRYGWLANATPLVSAEHLSALADQLSAGYQSAQPFPHVVIDNLFDDALLDVLLASFPDPAAPFWHRFKSDREIKLALDQEDKVPIEIRLFLYFLNGSTFLNFLERLTGISGLIPDPLWDGGGLHQIQSGGKLAIHADFNSHNHTKLDRRLNLLLYLNKDWQPEYGGDLELWDRDMKACVRKIAPLFNRTVVFSTTDYSFHGHPDVLTCPPGRARKSLALYYYSNGRPAGERSGSHATLFVRRPSDTFKSNFQRRLTPRMPKTLTRLMRYLVGP